MPSSGYCGTCREDGRCYRCKGTGKTKLLYTASDWCALCNGTGLCSSCDGTGSRDDSFYLFFDFIFGSFRKWRGKVRCVTCSGTGLNVCLNSTSDECERCRGTGWCLPED